MAENMADNMVDNIEKAEIAARLEGPRPPRLAEREALIAMINHVFRTMTGRPPTIATDWAHVYAPENLGNVNIIVDPAKADDPVIQSGQVVASTGVWVCDVQLGAATLRVGGINCVGTLPEYRRFGLGGQVMTAAHQTMRDLGCHVGLLSTGIANWYRRMGWEEAGQARTYRLNRGNIGLLPPLPAGMTMRFVTLDDGPTVDQMAALYQAARLGAVREGATFRQLATAKAISQMVVAEAANGVLGYLLLREHTIYETVGPAEVVAGLVRATYAALDDPAASTSLRAGEGGASLLRTLLWQTPGTLHPWHDLLDGLRIPFHQEYLGMLYVVNPQGVLDAFGVHGVDITERGDRFVVSAQGQSVTLDRGQLVKLFFGPERVSEVAAEIFPLPFWQWSLERV